MKQYQELVKDVLQNGTESGDRTGTGTLSVFGRQLRFDLSDSFPLLTTKYTYWRGVLVELLWLMRGETNIKFLTDRGVHIWDEWADENGNLGPVYGRQWRKWESTTLNDIKRFEAPEQNDITGTMQGIGNLGDNKKHVNHHMYKSMYQTWYGMLKRCYNKNHQAYENYGGKGVFVDNRWLTFSNFFEDVQKLENWNLKQAFPDEYSLDKDFYESNKYGPDSCRWSNIIEQSTNVSTNNNFFIAEDPQGNQTVEYGLRPFVEKYGLTKICVANVLKGINQTHKGWKFFKLYAPQGKIPRYKVEDQLKKAISEIKYNPNSRRILVSSYNVGDLKRMALEPCHTMFQFYVRNGKLSCQLYQRSADLFLGVPFNIASYAALTHLVANDAGLEVGDFVHTFGDVHIYNNHIPQCETLLEREPLKGPQLKVNLKRDDLMYWIDKVCHKLTWEEIQEVVQLTGYNHCGKLKGEVSV